MLEGVAAEHSATRESSRSTAAGSPARRASLPSAAIGTRYPSCRRRDAHERNVADPVARCRAYATPKAMVRAAAIRNGACVEPQRVAVRLARRGRHGQCDERQAFGAPGRRHRTQPGRSPCGRVDRSGSFESCGSFRARRSPPGRAAERQLPQGPTRHRSLPCCLQCRRRAGRPRKVQACVRRDSPQRSTPPRSERDRAPSARARRARCRRRRGLEPLAEPHLLA